mgnify:CR=1 FL=1
MFNSHTGAIGGGELWGYQLASVLNKHYDLRLYSLPGDIRFNKYYDFQIPFFGRTAFISNPDLYVHYSTHVIDKGKGKKNVLITCFPKKEWPKEIVETYDTIITLSRYSANYIKAYWDKKARLVHPAIDIRNYQIASKEDLIISVSRFFKEPGGQSKNQLELIEAFRHLNSGELKLALAGAVLTPQDQNYFDLCKEKAKDLRVEFYPNIERTELKTLLSKAKYFWHANGYGRTDPYEVEHFGIVYLEAMASGCIPIGFETGGSKEFIPFTFKDFDQLQKITLELEAQASNGLPSKLRYIASEYSMERMEKELLRALDN